MVIPGLLSWRRWERAVAEYRGEVEQYQATPRRLNADLTDLVRKELPISKSTWSMNRFSPVIENLPLR
jgi:hypothetical protein